MTRKTSHNGLTLERLDNGDVAATLGEKTVLIEAGIWVSLVLTMTAFDERCHDWHAFMEHHQGCRDTLTPNHAHNRQSQP